MSITPSTNYSIGASPVRIGYNVAGSLIINRSTNATAWFGPQFDVGSGRQGSTPLYPGTSVRWDRPGDLYAALGNDADSIAAGTVALTVSDQITGWQPDPVAQGAAIAAELLATGVQITATETVLYSAIGVAVTASSSLTGWIDVSTFDHVGLHVYGVTSYPDAYISVTWSADGIAALPSIGSYSSRAYYAGPINGLLVGHTFKPRARYMRLSADPGSSLPMTLSTRLIGSSRARAPWSDGSYRLASGSTVAAGSGYYVLAKLPAVPGRVIAVAYGPVYSPAAFSLYAQPATFGGMIYGAAEASARTLVGLYGELQFHNAGETSMEIVLASAGAGTFYWSIELLPD